MLINILLKIQKCYTPITICDKRVIKKVKPSYQQLRETTRENFRKEFFTFVSWNPEQMPFFTFSFSKGLFVATYNKPFCCLKANVHAGKQT